MKRLILSMIIILSIFIGCTEKYKIGDIVKPSYDSTYTQYNIHIKTGEESIVYIGNTGIEYITILNIEKSNSINECKILQIGDMSKNCVVTIRIEVCEGIGYLKGCSSSVHYYTIYSIDEFNKHIKKWRRN